MCVTVVFLGSQLSRYLSLLAVTLTQVTKVFLRIIYYRYLHSLYVLMKSEYSNLSIQQFLLKEFLPFDCPRKLLASILRG